jgi:hypothetical protein
MTPEGEGWAWWLLVHCFGPNLRSLNLNLEAFQARQLLQVAKSSPYLKEFVLKGPCSGAHADLARFFQSVGPSLTLLQLHTAPSQRMETCASVFKALAQYAESMEFLEFSTESKVSKDDINALAHPACMPRLEALHISNIKDRTPEGKKAGATDPCEEAIVAVLLSHKETLDYVSFDGGRHLLGSAFIEACLQLHHIYSVDLSRISPQTSIDLLERLYDNPQQLGSDWQDALHELNMRDLCSACLLVNSVVVHAKTDHQYPGAAGVSTKEATSQQWPEAESCGYCPHCFLPLALCLPFSPSYGRRLAETTRPLINFVAAQNPAWNVVGPYGEPAYWRPILRAL